MTSKTFEPTIKLVKKDKSLWTLRVEVSVEEGETAVEILGYPDLPLLRVFDDSGKLTSFHITINEDVENDNLWRSIANCLASFYIEGAGEEYNQAYHLFKLYFEPETAFYKGEAYAIDSHRKLYTALGTILTPPEDPDESWMGEYTEATEEQAKELTLWMY